MNPEEDANKEILWVLRIIKKAIRIQGYGLVCVIKVDFPELMHKYPDSPSLANIRRIVRNQLEKTYGVLEIVETYDKEWHKATKFVLEINEKKFENLYTKFRNTKSNPKDKNYKKNIECHGLSYSFETSQLSYSGRKQHISPETREMKFFITLHKNRGTTVDYKTIAREVGTQSYEDLSEGRKINHEDLNNKDFSEDASFLRRDFRNIALSLGMPAEKIAGMIRTIIKQGYQLTCQ